jgi:hypothetical protein
MIRIVFMEPNHITLARSWTSSCRTPVSTTPDERVGGDPGGFDLEPAVRWLGAVVISALEGTRVGVILGTAAYMAPTSGLTAWCCTRCSPASSRSLGRQCQTRWRQCSGPSPSGTRSLQECGGSSGDVWRKTSGPACKPSARPGLRSIGRSPVRSLK